MEGPRWAHQRLHDRWSTLLLRFGFSRGIIPCLGVLRHTGGASGVLVCAAPEIAEAPTLDEDVAAEERKKLPDRESPPPSEPPPSGWQVVAARGVASPSQDLERLRPFLERLEGAHFPVRLTLSRGPWVVLPVRDGQTLLGAMALWTLWGRSIAVGDFAYLQDLAALLGSAWGREHHTTVLHRALRLTAAANLVGGLLEKEGSTPETLLPLALEQVRRVVPFDRCTLYSLDWEAFRLEVLHNEGTSPPFDLFEQEQFLLGGGLKALALEQEKSIVLDHLVRQEMRSYAAIPASAPDRIFRLVGTFGARNSGVFTPKRLAWLSTFLQKVTGTLAMWRRQDLWRNEARTDEVTGLLNKRRCLRSLDEAWTHHLETGTPLALGFFDLDHFKQVNDTYGHLAGDVVLGRFGELLRAGSQGVGTPFRYGGEEFLVLMPEQDFRTAVLVCEEIRQSLAKEAWRTQVGSMQVSVSCGVSEALRDGATDVDDLVRRADVRLYRAKNRGRNRTVFSE